MGAEDYIQAASTMHTDAFLYINIYMHIHIYTHIEMCIIINLLGADDDAQGAGKPFRQLK